MVITTKEELKYRFRQHKAICLLIDSNLKELKTLEELAERTTPTYSLAPGGASNNSSKVETAVIKKIALEGKIQQDNVRLIQVENEIRGYLDLLDDYYPKLILHKRYLLNEKWSKIIDDVSFGERTVFRFYNEGLDEIIKRMAVNDSEHI